MPTPNSAVLLPSVLKLLTTDMAPEHKQKLAHAVAQVLAKGCTEFARVVKMAPGVPCAVAPPAMVGTVAGVGSLIGVVPLDPTLRAEAERIARAVPLIPADVDPFATTLLRLMSIGFEQYVRFAQVLPGGPIAGGVTAAPLSIAWPGGIATTTELDRAVVALKPRAAPVPPPPLTAPSQGGSWLPQPSHRGVPAPGAPMMGGHRTPPPVPPPPPAPDFKLMLPIDFAQIVARAVEGTLDQLSKTLLVAPGIPVVGQVTVASGDLI